MDLELENSVQLDETPNLDDLSSEVLSPARDPVSTSDEHTM